MTNIKTWITGLVLAALFPLVVGAHSFEVGSLQIGHPYARAMVPGAKVGGGYLTIANTGSQDDRLVGITSDRARSVQLHEMKVENNIMIMHEVEGGILVPAGQTVELKPGSYHVMFMNVAQPFQKGDMIKATLQFERSGSVDVEFAVGDMTGSGEEATQGKHEGHH